MASNGERKRVRAQKVLATRRKKATMRSKEKKKAREEPISPPMPPLKPSPLPKEEGQDEEKGRADARIGNSLHDTRSAAYRGGQYARSHSDQKFALDKRLPLERRLTDAIAGFSLAQVEKQSSTLAQQAELFSLRVEQIRGIFL